jgi:D-alanyl-D-alanine carboxypeptidase/D-alanyl-D-alanine-endopeptidase (penicillin-binding protein 4)
VLLAVFRAVRAAGIDAIDGNIITTNKGFDLNPTPPGWIWGDIGNYYGAGTLGLNWNENQYQLFIKTGSATGASTNIVSSDPPGYSDLVANNVSTGKPGTGDGSVIYADPFSSSALIQGKLEPNKTSMMVSGAMPNADEAALNAIREYLVKNGIAVKGTCITPLIAFADGMSLPSSVITVDSIVSPTLDSLNYWFLHKSINLYGEAFLRTIGLLKTGRGTNDDGIDAVQQYYTANGFDAESMHLYDGCGLSPANRVTPQTLTRAMYLAKSKSWFPDFYDGLPLYNDMKLKSGTINRVKCFTGYSKSKAGADYVVTIMVNNYNGSSSSLVSKMYSVLDCLK